MIAVNRTAKETTVKTPAASPLFQKDLRSG